MTAVPISAFCGADARPRVLGARLVLVLFAIAAIVPRIGFLARPFDSDSGLYIYMGKVVAEGQTLYHDFYETKMPGVALFTAPLYQAFGFHWTPYVLLQAGMTIFAACRPTPSVQN